MFTPVYKDTPWGLFCQIISSAFLSARNNGRFTTGTILIITGIKPLILMLGISCRGKGKGTPLPSRLICKLRFAGLRSIPPLVVGAEACSAAAAGEEAGFAFCGFIGSCLSGQSKTSFGIGKVLDLGGGSCPVMNRKPFSATLLTCPASVALKNLIIYGY